MFSMLCVKLTYFYMWATHQSFRVWKLNLKRKYFSQTGHATDASKKLFHATLKCHQVILEFVCISFKDNCLFVSCRLLQYYLCYPSVSINLNFTNNLCFCHWMCFESSKYVSTPLFVEVCLPSISFCLWQGKFSMTTGICAFPGN